VLLLLLLLMAVVVVRCMPLAGADTATWGMVNEVRQNERLNRGKLGGRSRVSAGWGLLWFAGCTVWVGICWPLLLFVTLPCDPHPFFLP
jgi:hypothetical protein